MNKSEDKHGSVPRIRLTYHPRFARTFIILTFVYILGYTIYSLSFKKVTFISFMSFNSGLPQHVSVLMTLIIGFFFIITYTLDTIEARQVSKIDQVRNNFLITLTNL